MWRQATFIIIALLLAASTPISDNEYNLPNHVIPSLYSLTFHAEDLEPDVFVASLTIYFTTNKTTSEILLYASSEYISINFTWVVNQDYNGTCNFAFVNSTTDTGRISCTKNFTAGEEYRINIQYEGRYSEDGRGVYKNWYKNDNVTDVAVSTQLEPIYARRLFPCFDEPIFKAQYDITIIHTSEYAVRGNMPVSKKSSYSPITHLTTTIFERTPPISSYLVAFLISKFNYSQETSDEGYTFAVHSRPGTEKYRATALQYGIALVNDIGNWTDINYPNLGDRQIDQVALPLLPVGAMENWGLITYDEFNLLDEGKFTTADQKQRIITTMSHELAHQWFGDAATLHWWSDTWLNEGFATYFEYNNNWGGQEFDLTRQFELEVIQTALEVDSYPSTPLSSNDNDVQTESQINGKFDQISYFKGASILYMLKNIMGFDNFQNATRLYFEENINKTTSVEALCRCLDKYYSGPYEMNTLLDSYLHKPGYPLLNVKLKDDKTVTVTQEEFSIIKKEEESNSTWYIPVTYTTSGHKNFDVEVHTYYDGKIPIYFGLKSDAWIILNIGHAGFYRVNYEPELWKRIIDALNGPEMTDIEVMTRAALVSDIFNIARTGRVSYETVFELAKYIRNETEYFPWKTYLNVVSYILDHISDKNTRNLVETTTLDWLNAAFPELGGSNTSHVNILRDVLINRWKCSLEDKNCLSYVQTAFETYKQNLSIVDFNERPFIFCHAVRNNSENFEFLFQVFNTSDSSYERRVILKALGCVLDLNTLSWYLSQLLEDESVISKQEAVTVFEGILDGSDKGVQAVEAFLEDNLQTIITRYKGYVTAAALINGLAAKINNAEYLKKLKGIIESNTGIVPGVEDIGKAAVILVENNLAWTTAYSNDIKSTLQSSGGHNLANSSTFVVNLLTSFTIILTYCFS